MRGGREPAPMTKPGRTSGAGRRTMIHYKTRRPAPVVFSPRFRDAVRRVTKRGRSQRNARGRVVTRIVSIAMPMSLVRTMVRTMMMRYLRYQTADFCSVLASNISPGTARQSFFPRNRSTSVRRRLPLTSLRVRIMLHLQSVFGRGHRQWPLESILWARTHGRRAYVQK
jgi:hypothetical protein